MSNSALLDLPDLLLKSKDSFVHIFYGLIQLIHSTEIIAAGQPVCITFYLEKGLQKIPFIGGEDLRGYQGVRFIFVEKEKAHFKVLFRCHFLIPYICEK